MIEAALFELLTAASSLTDLVGDRIYPIAAPQTATAPMVEYQMITAETGYAHDGPTGYVQPLFQFTVTGRTYLEAKTVCAALRQALSGYRGKAAETQIYSIFCVNRYDETANLSTGLCTVREDYRISYQEI